MQNLYEIFSAGGFVMYPLAICSLITWAITLERAWSLKQTAKETRELGAQMDQLIGKGDINTALELCKRSTLPFANAMEELITAAQKNKSDTNALAARANRKRMEMNQEYKRYLWALGTIGSATPFLGLFGTVVGILRAFNRIAQTGETGFSVVAAGISEALIATAAGIIVAVIAVALYNYFQVKVAKVSLESRLLMEELLEKDDEHKKEPLRQANTALDNAA